MRFSDLEALRTYWATRRAMNAVIRVYERARCDNAKVTLQLAGMIVASVSIATGESIEALCATVAQVAAVYRDLVQNRSARTRGH